MTTLIEIIRAPWAWYVAGPLIGLMVPALLLAGNKSFGISTNLRHLCAVALPGRAPYFGAARVADLERHRHSQASPRHEPATAPLHLDYRS